MIFEIAGITLPIWLPILWGGLVGLVFSTVGAAGGILASVGLISVMGILDPNLVKPTSQALTLATPLIAVPSYYRQHRVVISLAIILGLGGILGAVIGSTLSVSYLNDFNIFRWVFGILALGIALQILSRLLKPNRLPKTHSERAAAAFEGLVHDGVSPGCHWCQAPAVLVSPHSVCVRWRTIQLRTLGSIADRGWNSHNFFSTWRRRWVPAGAVYEHPFGLSSVTSIANYMRLGIELDIPLLLLLLAGTVIGAWIGPRLGEHLHERWLQGSLGVVLLLIGIWYLDVFGN